MEEPSTSTQSQTIEVPKMIVPDKILQQQKCSECHNYLSIGPVMITTANKTICGRCVQNHPNKESLNKSMYDIIARGLIFKCIYHFQGCRALVPYVQISKDDKHELHEENCMYKDQNHDFDCSKCSFKAKTGSELIFHLEQYNMKVIMDSNFIYKLGDSFDACLVKNDFLFQVEIGYEKYNFDIRVSSYVANKDLKSFTFIIRAADSEIEHLIINSKHFNKMNYVNVESLKTILIECQEVSCKFDITRHNLIEEDLFKAQNELSIVKRNCKEYAALQAGVVKLLNVYYPLLLKCSRCRNESKNMLLCRRGHSVCCNQCNDDCKQPKTDFNVTKNVFEQITNLPCEWKGCKQILNFNEFMSHKIYCEYRIYTCPVDNCSFRAESVLFKKHFYGHMADNIDIKMENNVPLNIYNNKYCYWLLNKKSFEIVKLQWITEWPGRGDWGPENVTISISTNEPLLVYNRYFFYTESTHRGKLFITGSLFNNDVKVCLQDVPNSITFLT